MQDSPAESSARETLQVSEAETAATLSIPAIAINRFFIAVGPSGVRLTFAEQGGEGQPPHMRAAVSMCVADASSLGAVLLEVVEKLANFDPIQRDAAAAMGTGSE